MPSSRDGSAIRRMRARGSKPRSHLPVDSGATASRPVDESGGSRERSHRKSVAGALEAFDETTEALGLRELCRSWGDAGERLSNVEAVRAHVVRYGSLAASVGRAATPWGLIAYLEEVQEDELDTRSAFEGADAVTVSTCIARRGWSGRSWSFWTSRRRHQRARSASTSNRSVEDRPGESARGPVGAILAEPYQK
ncbi:MAG: hypothetical protein IPF82_24175 [Blastocatellia bacterium]|nr:hypothetical protein [Blastocatellia bacterium]